ncbi:putative leucine-rich repeat-containing, plant-type, leucine-rich repeat domain superfamily [Helianthus anomalus]
MESGLSAHIYLCLAFVMLSMMASHIHCVCVAEERKTFLQIKAALPELLNGVRDPLSTWVGLDTSASECCEWERIECDPTTGHISSILLGNLFMLDQFVELEERYYSKFLQGWMKFSPFLCFKELKSMDLSFNFFDDTIVVKFKKLEVLNLSHSNIKTNVFPLLAGLTALKVFNLSFINPFQQQYSPAHGILFVFQPS